MTKIFPTYKPKVATPCSQNPSPGLDSETVESIHILKGTPMYTPKRGNAHACLPPIYY
jgi:hypothetical protein